MNEANDPWESLRVLTIFELVDVTREGERSLRGKLKAGKFKGAYRTNGWRGPWRIPLRSVRAYQKSLSITID